MTSKFQPDDEIQLHSGRTSTDIFLSCASFEPRSSTVSKNLNDQFRAAEGIIYYNKELEDESDEKLDGTISSLKDNLPYHCEELNFIRGSICDPVTQLDVIKESLNSAEKRIGKVESITVDITTFNRESLLILFNILESWFPGAEIDILYVSPEEYGEWLSQGHRSIRNVMGFTGMHSSNRSMALIVLSGFEKDRTFKIVEELEPAVVYLGIGEEPTKDQFLERNKQHQQIIKNRQDTIEFGFPADDIDSSAEIVMDQVDNLHDQYNIVFAPMSTKLSTLGCWKIASEYPQSQIVYALPAEYNYTNYSSGVRSVYTDSFLIDS